MGVTKKAIYRKSASQICCKESNFRLQAPFSRGERLIVLYAGSKAGFLKGTELVRKAKSSTGDYHDEMNGDSFFKWVKEKLIPHLPTKSVLIIDNAPYQNLQVDKYPTQASRKADIQAWLTRQRIPFGLLFKAELLQICKQHKPTPSFLLDNILQEYGHDCLRLPAYHADLTSTDLGNDERIHQKYPPHEKVNVWDSNPPPFFISRQYI